MSSPVHSPTETLNPELGDYQRQFELIKQEAVNLSTGLKESQFNWRPGEGRWSIAECLHHLTITGDRFMPGIERAISEGRTKGLLGQGPFRYGWLETRLVRSAEPPPQRKFKTARSLTPLHGQPITAVLPTFLHLQDQLMLCLRQANGLDLSRLKVAMPVARFLKLGIGPCFAFLAAHERRHLWQARQVRNDPRFPQA